MLQSATEFKMGTAPPGTVSAWRAWCYLIWLSMQRQARMRQMVWIALALLGITSCIIGLATLNGRWTMNHWRWVWMEPAEQFGAEPHSHKDEGPLKPGYDPRMGRAVILTFRDSSDGLQKLACLLPGPAQGVADGIAAATTALLNQSGFYVFARWIVFSVFVGFLLPIWSLSFATDALGNERETNSLVWLLTRPLPRATIYLARFVAVVPWSLALNLGGFGILCVLAGPSGRQAFRLFWLAVLGGSLAFCSLFFLMGALFRRAAVIALVYAFFLETILGSMPGYMKRISISFYTRCLMFEAAQGTGVQAEKPSIYLPVSGTVAWSVLLGITVGLLLLGMVLFARTEIQDLA